MGKMHKTAGKAHRGFAGSGTIKIYKAPPSTPLTREDVRELLKNPSLRDVGRAAKKYVK